MFKKRGFFCIFPGPEGDALTRSRMATRKKRKKGRCAFNPAPERGKILSPGRKEKLVAGSASPLRQRFLHDEEKEVEIPLGKENG